MTISTASHFRIAWRSFKSHSRVFILSMLVLFASWVSLELCVVAFQSFGVVLNLLLHLAFLLLFSGLIVGIHSIAMEVVDGGGPSLKRLSASMERGPSFFLAFCVYFVAVMGGLLLLVVPGVYITVRYALFGQVFATKHTSALEALRDAGALSHGRWGATFRLLLAALALNVAGAALLGLGLVISFPVSLLAASSFFRALQHTTVALGSAQPNNPLQATAGGGREIVTPGTCARGA